jgi:hypothetical protein
MADGRLRVIGVPPCGSGLRKELSRLAAEGTVFTALEDAKLSAIKRMLPHDVEVEVAVLGELVGRFLTMLGEPIARLCPRGQLVATVELVCVDLPSDSPLAESSRFRGTADAIVQRLGELRDWSLTAERLSEVASRASSPLGAKLESLVTIDDAVRRIMEETNRQFASDRVERSLAISPLLSVPVKRVVVAVGSAEKPVYEQWLRWITRFGIDVYVLVDWSKGTDHQFPASSRCAERLGAKIEVGRSAEPWTSCLFTDRTTDKGPEIEIVSAADPLGEAEWAMRGCIARTKAGVLPHRIGIFARSPDEYGPLLLASSKRLGVLLSASINVPLLTNGFAALTLSCLEVLAGNDVRALSRLAQSSYFQTAQRQNEDLRAAAKAAYAQGAEQWPALADWAGQQGEEFAWLRHALAWRERNGSSRANLSDWLRRLRELVGGTQMVDLAADPHSETRQRDISAQTVLQRSIGDMAYAYDRAGLAELGLEAFVEHARRVWANETVVVEGTPNGVRFLSNTDSLTEFDTLFVVGMLEGTLPRRRREDPILSDDDRAELSSLLGLRLVDSRDTAVQERDEFVRICSAASSRLVFSYPQTDDAKDNVPAFYLEEVRRTCPDKTTIRARPRSEFVPLEGECLADSDLKIRKALSGDRVPFDRAGLVQDDARACVRPVFEAGVSPEEFSRSLVCPFQAAMRYRLRVVAPARRRLMRSLRDLPAIAKLGQVSSRQEATERLHRAIGEYLEEMYPEFEGWELSMLGAAARRMADEWVDREFRSRELWREEGEKTWVDVSLDEHGLKNEMSVGGQKIKLVGRVSTLTRRNALSVMRFFDGSKPELAETTEVPAEKEDAFLYGLYLMTQLPLPERNPAVEIDAMSGKRVFAGFKDIGRHMKKDPMGGLEVVRISDSRDVFFQNVKGRLREAVAVLASGEMKAIPGKHCEPCPYGELCRVSSVFGETDDPFEEASE